jgi:LmbE family N-acetylglucosaminyl deacetylase
MLGVTFSRGRDDAYNILCLGAHPDDIEIGCGGTILQLIRTYPNLTFYWVVFSGTDVRAREARAGAARFLEGARHREIEVKSFRDGFFPAHHSEMKLAFEALKEAFVPDLVFTHYRHDRHQDHRLLSDLTWRTFRDHWILEYEILKYDGDLGRPNAYVPLDEATCQQKLQHLEATFASQRARPWFTEDAFLALLRIRGVEVQRRYAEAFHCRKLVLA